MIGFSLTRTTARAHSIVSIALIVGFGVALGACSKHPDANTKTTAPTLTVETVSPMQQQWPERISASGEIAAWQEAIIGAEVGGVRLHQVLVNVGDTVKKGQLLAHFNEDSLRIDLARLEAALAEAQANSDLAKADAERANLLDQSGSFSQQEIQQFKTKAATAVAQVASVKAQRDAQQLKLRYARVLAPDNGVISARTATAGTVVNPNSELFRLIRSGRLEWRAEVSAVVIGRLKPGMGANIVRPDGKTVSAKLRQVAPTVARNTGNALVYVDVPDKAGLGAGMYVSGELVLGSTSSLAVPESAIVLRDGFQYLMQIDANNQVHQIKIETRRRYQNAIEVISDQIKPDAKFVRAAGGLLNDGDYVLIATAKPAAAQAPAPKATPAATPATKKSAPSGIAP